MITNSRGRRPTSALVALAGTLALCAACGPDTRDHPEDTDDQDSWTDTGTDTDSDTDTGSDTGSDTETVTDTGTEGDAGAFDCATIPTSPLAVEELVDPIALHDVAFDSEGFIIGSDGTSLFKTAISGSAGIWVMGLYDVQGMDGLPGGDLVVSTSNLGLIRVTPTGTTSVIDASLSPFGVTVGPDGMVYAGDNNYLYRIDPDTHEVETLPTYLNARTVEFSPDLTVMYFGGSDSDIIMAVEIDEDVNWIGEPWLYATLPGCQQIDGIGADICGDLYVPCKPMYIYRVTPDGTATIYHTWTSENSYAHGIAWGSGIGGWDAMSLYMPQPYDDTSVVRVEIGVPYRE